MNFPISISPIPIWSKLEKNNANFDVGPPVVVPPPQSQKKESHENIARIAKRYLDDNMQQAWINPRLISMTFESVREAFISTK
ncbi:hypothetical protein M0804_001290 [Polistes exclamans]|nr:hypothetical protein M0804_001290 [Polistes exclamans]